MLLKAITKKIMKLIALSVRTINFINNKDKLKFIHKKYILKQDNSLDKIINFKTIYQYKKKSKPAIYKKQEIVTITILEELYPYYNKLEYKG